MIFRAQYGGKCEGSVMILTCSRAKPLSSAKTTCFFFLSVDILMQDLGADFNVNCIGLSDVKHGADMPLDVSFVGLRTAGV